jgi:glycosyltransferase involved in cell wall biosynthesis
MSTRERILVIANGHPAIDKGGVEIVAYNQFKEIDSRPDCDAMFFAALPNGPTDRGTRVSRRKDNEVLLSTHTTDFFKLSQAYKPAILWHFKELLELFQPTVVHIHAYIHLGVEIIRGVHNYSPDVPIVLTLHEYLAICNQNGQMVKRGSHKLCFESSPADCHRCFPEHSPADFFLRKRFIQSFFSLVDQFISPSQFLAERYIEWGLPADKIRVLQNGQIAAGHKEAGATRSRRGAGRRTSKRGDSANFAANLRTLKTKRLRFGFFGQITPFKGVDILLEAATHLPQSIREEISISVHGTGFNAQSDAYRRKIGSLLRETKDCARLHGPYEPRDLETLMLDVDWVVVPSIWWENSPVVIEEAFCYGRPVICSDIGGMAEKVRDGIDGLHFKVASPEDLAAAIESIVAGHVDWDELHRNGREPISVPESTDEHLALYAALKRTKHEERRRAASESDTSVWPAPIEAASN